MSSLRRLRLLGEDAAARARGALAGAAVRAYWYRGVRNFGDQVTPFLLRRLGLAPLHAPIARAELVSTGSLLQWLPPDYRGVILGAGLLEEAGARRFPEATVLALRGPLTRERIGAPEDVVLGDPALLVPRWLPPRGLAPSGAPERALALVPHYADRGDERVARLARRLGRAALVVNVRRPPARVFRELGRCGAVLSSSLHGLIAADALGLPRARLVLSDRVAGGDFKFRDHDAALGIESAPLTLEGDEELEPLVERTQLAPPERVRELQGDLERVFRAWAEGRAARGR